MSELPERTTEQAPSRMTAAEMREVVKGIRQRLADAAAAMAGVEAWSMTVPRRHVDGDPVLVRDLAQKTVADPDRLAQDLTIVAGLADRLASMITLFREGVVEQTGNMGPDGGWLPTDAQAAAHVNVTVWLGGDDDRFERQRRAANAAALEFNGGSRNWRGQLPAYLGDNVSAWSALVEAAEAGAAVHISL